MVGQDLLSKVRHSVAADGEIHNIPHGVDERVSHADVQGPNKANVGFSDALPKHFHSSSLFQPSLLMTLVPPRALDPSWLSLHSEYYTSRSPRYWLTWLNLISSSAILLVLRIRQTSCHFPNLSQCGATPYECLRGALLSVKRRSRVHHFFKAVVLLS